MYIMNKVYIYKYKFHKIIKHNQFKSLMIYMTLLRAVFVIVGYRNLNPQLMNKLEAFDILKVAWTAYTVNDKVLKKVGAKGKYIRKNMKVNYQLS